AKEGVTRLLGRQAAHVLNPDYLAYAGKLISAAEVVKKALRDGHITFAHLRQVAPGLAAVFPADHGPTSLNVLELLERLTADVGGLRTLLRDLSRHRLAETLPDIAPDVYPPHTREPLQAPSDTGQAVLIHHEPVL